MSRTGVAKIACHEMRQYPASVRGAIRRGYPTSGADRGEDTVERETNNPGVWQRGLPLRAHANADGRTSAASAVLPRFLPTKAYRHRGAKVDNPSSKIGLRPPALIR